MDLFGPLVIYQITYLGIFAASLYLEDGSLSYTLCMLEGTKLSSERGAGRYAQCGRFFLPLFR